MFLAFYRCSFGQTAIFLIGGKTIDEEPTAIFLKSGDIAVMSRESRLSYHAVPRILKTDVSWISAPQSIRAEVETCGGGGGDGGESSAKKRKLTDDTPEDSLVDDIWELTADEGRWKPFAEYISDCRININVRQVLGLGETSL